jgi:hypothetical protein
VRFDRNVTIGENCVVGEALGAALEMMVGCAVGATEGGGLGDALGVAVGITVCDGVGARVGTAVGVSLSWAVGNAVGSTVGTTVGATVGKAVGDCDTASDTFLPEKRTIMQQKALRSVFAALHKIIPSRSRIRSFAHLLTPQLHAHVYRVVLDVVQVPLCHTLRAHVRGATLDQRVLRRVNAVHGR